MRRHPIDVYEATYMSCPLKHSPPCTALLLLFAYATGLRRAELAKATTGDLTRNALDGALEDAWELKVHGKGRRKHHVPMPARLMEEPKRELLAREQPSVSGRSPKETPLIAHLQTGKPLTPDAVARLPGGLSSTRPTYRRPPTPARPTT